MNAGAIQPKPFNPQLGKPLSPRETQFMDLMTSGKLWKQIAVEMGISVHTVRNHSARAYRKLGALNNSHAARLFFARANLLVVKYREDLSGADAVAFANANFENAAGGLRRDG